MQQIDAAVKQRIADLRAQGATIREIEADLRASYPHSAVSDSTIVRWLATDEASPLVKRAADTIRATAAHRTAELVSGVYDGLAKAIERDDARSADAWSRAVVALTRGFVAEKHELAPQTAPTQDSELHDLAKRLGVILDTAPANPQS